MELGALVCVPGTPRCGECPLVGLCQGYAAGRAAELPVKPAPKAKARVPVTVALIESEAGLLLQRRPARGLLAGLWQPAAWEKSLTREELTAALANLGVQAALNEPLSRQSTYLRTKSGSLAAGAAPHRPAPCPTAMSGPPPPSWPRFTPCRTHSVRM